MRDLGEFKCGDPVRIPTSEGVVVGKILRGGCAWWTVVEVMCGAGKTERVKYPAETPAEADDER